jgi:DNA-binding transcriptional regulator LsrR (DeoR family)
MSRTTDPAEARLLYKASELYYLQDHTQQQVADRLGLSRPKVSRLLRRARERGIVQIAVVPATGFVEQEAALEQIYGLDEVILVDAGERTSGDHSLKQHLGAAAAAYLRRTVSDGDTIGIAWGTTLQAMVNALQPLSVRDIQVVQIVGGMGPPEAEAHAADLSRRLARLLGGSLTLLPAPSVVGNRATKDILLAEHYVQTAGRLFPHLTVAFTGIGALSTNPLFSSELGAASDADYEELESANAVGDIANRFFNTEGVPIQASLDDRTIGVTLDELRRVPRVVGIAGGSPKHEAVRAALEGGFIDVLITDRTLADALS